MTITIRGTAAARNMHAEVAITGKNVTAVDLIMAGDIGVKAALKATVGAAIRMGDPAAAISIFQQIFNLDCDPNDVKGRMTVEPIPPPSTPPPSIRMKREGFDKD